MKSLYFSWSRLRVLAALLLIHLYMYPYWHLSLWCKCLHWSISWLPKLGEYNDQCHKEYFHIILHINQLSPNSLRCLHYYFIWFIASETFRYWYLIRNLVRPVKSKAEILGIDFRSSKQSEELTYFFVHMMSISFFVTIILKFPYDDDTTKRSRTIIRTKKRLFLMYATIFCLK